MSSFNNDTKRIVHRVLEDTRYAYKICSDWDNLNADYAEYASAQALDDFRRALGQTDLTMEQLCKMLRRAQTKERRRQCKTPWAMFMTNYLERNTGANGQI